MALKLCTDEHPEYYGMLSGEQGDEEGADEEAKPIEVLESPVSAAAAN